MIASPSQAGSQTAGSSNSNSARTEVLQQDDQGPLDGELLDLYVAILIAVPLACFLRYLWS